MTQHFFIGVDGGATKCSVRLEDESGQLLASSISGPANIRISVDQTWDSIHTALATILQQQSISLEHKSNIFHAGMGLAGCEMQEAYQRFMQYPHPFHTLVVSSDAHTACLGAHAGTDGAIIIAGTGVVGFAVQGGQTTKVGGWGFPHDDIGGGAWIGLNAVTITLQALDGRLPMSGLSRAIYQYFNANEADFITWVNQANSTMFAELAPIVIAQSQQGDATAIEILVRAAWALEQIADALERAQIQKDSVLPYALMGGVAPYLHAHFSPTFLARLHPIQATPEQGAILLVRQHLLFNQER